MSRKDTKVKREVLEWQSEETRLFDSFNRHAEEQVKIDHLLSYVAVLRTIQRLKREQHG